MPFQTQPGTAPHRVVEWFKQQPEGTEVAAVVVCEALEIDHNSFSSWMKAARKAGLLRARNRRGEGRTLFWSLGDGTPEPDQDEEDDESKRKPGRPRKPSGDGQAVEQREEVEFDACMWGASGDLIVYGAQPTEDGGILLTPQQQAVIKRLITWTVPA